VHALGEAAALHRHHLIQQALGALGGAPAKVAFPTLGTDKHSRPSYAKSLGCRFMGFEFVLSYSLLTWHDKTPLTQNSAGQWSTQLLLFYRGSITVLIQQDCKKLPLYFFLAVLEGAKIIKTLRPSMAGGTSTEPTSDSSSATSFKSSSAKST